MAKVDFSLLDPAFLADPYPTYHRLRAEDPVHYSPLGFWVLTRYQDVVGALRDPRLAKEAIGRAVAERLGTPAPTMNFSMLDSDPPNHTRLRTLVSKVFSAALVRGVRPRIREIVDRLLQSVESAGGMDLMEDFAYPVPMMTIGELLGIPVEDQDRFKAWSLDIVRGLDDTLLPPDSDRSQRTAAANGALADYFRALIAHRRAFPGSDMLSALITAEEGSDRLKEEELLATCVLLLIAGYETTVNLIGNGSLALLRNPDQLRRLRENPALIIGAVEEVLRFDAPVQRVARIATMDVTIGDRTIARGELVMPFIGAADRDPAQFSDPDRLDITRSDARHIAFGSGIHLCLGAQLARLEGQIALNTLVQRFPKLTLTRDEPEYRQSLTLRGLKTLSVAF